MKVVLVEDGRVEGAVIRVAGIIYKVALLINGGGTKDRKAI